MEERQQKVLEQIGSKLWFPRQPKALIDLQWGKCCPEDIDFIFYRLVVIFADNEVSHTILDEFDFEPDRTIHIGVTRPRATKYFSIDL